MNQTQVAGASQSLIASDKGTGAATMAQARVNKFNNTHEIRVTFTASGSGLADNTIHVLPGAIIPSKATLPANVTFTAANSSHESQAAFRNVCETIGFQVEEIRIEDPSGTNFDSILRLVEGALNGQDPAAEEIPLSNYKESLGGALNTRVVIPKSFTVGPRTRMSLGIKQSTSVTVVFRVSEAGVVVTGDL